MHHCVERLIHVFFFLLITGILNNALFLLTFLKSQFIDYSEFKLLLLDFNKHKKKRISFPGLDMLRWLPLPFEIPLTCI